MLKIEVIERSHQMFKIFFKIFRSIRSCLPLHGRFIDQCFNDFFFNFTIKTNKSTKSKLLFFVYLFLGLLNIFLRYGQSNVLFDGNQGIAIARSIVILLTRDFREFRFQNSVSAPPQLRSS